MEGRWGWKAVGTLFYSPGKEETENNGEEAGDRSILTADPFLIGYSFPFHSLVVFNETIDDQ